MYMALIFLVVAVPVYVIVRLIWGRASAWIAVFLTALAFAFWPITILIIVYIWNKLRK